jgi:regulator of replication initiation timing
MEKQIKKLYRNLAEIRDYDVQAAIDKNEHFKIKYEGDVMTLSPEDLKNKVASTSKTTFKSKVGGKDYRLIGYEWNPDDMDY